MPMNIFEHISNSLENNDPDQALSVIYKFINANNINFIIKYFIDERDRLGSRIYMDEHIIFKANQFFKSGFEKFGVLFNTFEYQDDFRFSDTEIITALDRLKGVSFKYAYMDGLYDDFFIKLIQRKCFEGIKELSMSSCSNESLMAILGMNNISVLKITSEFNDYKVFSSIINNLCIQQVMFNQSSFSFEYPENVRLASNHLRDVSFNECRFLFNPKSILEDIVLMDLESLNIKYVNGFSSLDELAYLFNLFSKSTGKRLCLSGIMITKSLLEIINDYEEKGTIEELDLSGSHMLKNESLLDVINLIKSYKVKKLNLYGVGIDDNKIQTIASKCPTCEVFTQWSEDPFVVPQENQATSSWL